MRTRVSTAAVWALLGLVLVLLAALADGPAARAQAPAPAPASANPEVASTTAQAAPVRFRNETLFSVDKPIGALSARQRAQAIEQRLATAAGGRAEILSRLRVVHREDRSELYAGETLIKTVTDADAAGTGRTRMQLAADQLQRVRMALFQDFRARSASRLALGAALAAGSTVLLVAVLMALRSLDRLARQRIVEIAPLWRQRSGVAPLRLMAEADLARIGSSLSGTVILILALLVLYLYLQFVFSQFPWTHGLSDRMVGAALRSIGGLFTAIVSYLPKAFSIVVIVLVAHYALKIIRSLFRAIEAGHLAIDGFYPEWASPTFAIVRFFVIAIAMVMVFPYLPGSGSAGFQGVAAFLGLAVSLGGAGAIGNLIAGLVITYMRPFAIGDRVKIADAVGDVVFKDLLVVRLRTIKNVEITIPNALVLSNHIINFSARARAEGLILHTSVTIGYDVPWQTVHELLITAAKRVAGVMAKPEPFVLQTSLDDFYVAYELNAYTDRANEQAGLYSRLHAEIQEAFNAAGVEILSPHYSAVRDGNAMAVPSDYLPKDYKAPGFSVLSTILRPGSRPAP